MLIRTLDEETELRLLAIQHAQAYFEAVSANRDRLYWLEGEFSPEDAVARIRARLAQLADGTGLHACIWRRGEFVGVVALNKVDSRAGSCELGYWLDSSAEGKGLVTRACAAMIDYAFGELGLRRVEIKIAESNLRSRAVPERLGFTHEGTARKAEPVRGRWEDLLVYGLLAEEWTPKA